MVSRIGGAFLMRREFFAGMLMTAGAGAVVLTIAAISMPGATGAAALILVGFCHSIMYPTKHPLALPRSTTAAPLGPMVLCMSVVGGAVIPVLTGLAVDWVGFAFALAMPALCYIEIGAPAWFWRRAPRPLKASWR